jgi:hypothetical protein
MIEKRNCRATMEASDAGRIWGVARVPYACESSMKNACGAGYGDERRCNMKVLTARYRILP